VIRSEEFAVQLRAPRAGEVQEDVDVHLSAEELAEWLKVFSEGDER
jgi:hypothetical protein